MGSSVFIPRRTASLFPGQPAATHSSGTGHSAQCGRGGTPRPCRRNRLVRVAGRQRGVDARGLPPHDLAGTQVLLPVPGQQLALHGPACPEQPPRNARPYRRKRRPHRCRGAEADEDTDLVFVSHSCGTFVAIYILAAVLRRQPDIVRRPGGFSLSRWDRRSIASAGSGRKTALAMP